MNVRKDEINLLFSLTFDAETFQDWEQLNENYLGYPFKPHDRKGHSFADQEVLNALGLPGKPGM